MCLECCRDSVVDEVLEAGENLARDLDCFNHHTAAHNQVQHFLSKSKINLFQIGTNLQIQFREGTLDQLPDHFVRKQTRNFIIRYSERDIDFSMTNYDGSMTSWGNVRLWSIFVKWVWTQES